MTNRKTSQIHSDLERIQENIIILKTIHGLIDDDDLDYLPACANNALNEIYDLTKDVKVYVNDISRNKE